MPGAFVRSSLSIPATAPVLHSASERPGGQLYHEGEVAREYCGGEAMKCTAPYLFQFRFYPRLILPYVLFSDSVTFSISKLLDFVFPIPIMLIPNLGSVLDSNTRFILDTDPGLHLALITYNCSNFDVYYVIDKVDKLKSVTYYNPQGGSTMMCDDGARTRR
ncbi:hypothetical protein EVAR_92068_1 [Eumeta japonica]|uniref:Uncharacterized protein n=1 Tax=Eumeta variegata TaxID=151549 RepID=A0A4C1T1L1_EUMVA|nr:hypothetical protein EVAR_92068_1 [Eumeta japonica]